MSRPYDSDDALSVIVLGTTRSPGVVTLSGHDAPKKWDVKAAKGTTGASMTLGGDEPRKFSASFYLADDSNPRDIDLDVVDQFAAWDAFQRLVESMTPKGGAPFALPIYHPDLARVGITEVTSAGVHGMTHDGRGGSTVVVDFIEYKPPKPKKTSGAGAKASSGVSGSTSKPARVDPNAAAKAELAGLLAKAREP